MIILGIETSCDETGAAVLEKAGNRITILSNVVASSASLQEKFGGIIPEQAAREQIKVILPVIQEALTRTKCTPTDVDAIAVTYGPGLIGSLLVGVETSKTLALIWEKPLIPINHLIGHFYANWIGNHPSFPILGLLVSGGHTDLVLFTGHGKYQYLGGTRDDAAGECFDKCARLLGLPYPGGPQISKLAKKGNPKAFNLPRPIINEKNFDFSFSGLKTAVANLIISLSPSLRSRVNSVKGINPKLYSSPTAQNDKKLLQNLAASIEQAIVEVLVEKTIKAAQKYGIKQIMLAGGVAANQKLVEQFRKTINHQLPTTNLFVPPPQLCTDNGAMIAASAFFQKSTKDPLSLQADPNLHLTTGAGLLKY